MAFLFSRGSRNSRPMRQRRSFVPQFEPLEDRSLPSTLTVLNTQDGGAGSLRDAIARAKDGDTIAFAPSLAGQTIVLTNSELDQLKKSLIKVRCAQAPVIEGHDCDNVKVALVRIWPANIPDPQMRQRLQAVPTGLTIPDEDVDSLVSAGESLVQQNAAIRQLISDLDGQAAVVAAQAGLRSGKP